MPKDCVGCGYYRVCPSFYGGPECAYKEEIEEHGRKMSELATETNGKSFQDTVQ